MWRKVKALCTMYFALWTEYRAELYLWALAGILPLILMGVWSRASEGGAFVLGPVEFVRYFLAVFVVRQLTVVWVIWEFEDSVVRGTLSPLLLMPIDPGWRHALGHVTERAARLPFMLVVLGVGFLLYPEALWVPDAKHLGLGLAATAVALAVRFIMQYAVAMLCFWSERASSVEEVWYLFFLFLSGMVAPLDVFPPAVRRIAEFTPFPHMLYLPAQLLVGKDPPLGKPALVLAAWGAASFVVYRVLWHRGLRRYSAMGA
jgi:ABC-2 type transport system permease protein